MTYSAATPAQLWGLFVPDQKDPVLVSADRNALHASECRHTGTFDGQPTRIEKVFIGDAAAGGFEIFWEDFDWEEP